MGARESGRHRRRSHGSILSANQAGEDWSAWPFRRRRRSSTPVDFCHERLLADRAAEAWADRGAQTCRGQEKSRCISSLV